jgi:hypothetical protein
MEERLFAFAAQGVADISAGYRLGARHALLVFATAPTIEEAWSKGATAAAEHGWIHVDLKRKREISADTSSITDESVRSAADSALMFGASLVVYPDEMPTDG